MEAVQLEPLFEENLPELKAGVVLAVTSPMERLIIFDRVNKYDKMLRSMAYLIRFAKFIASRKQSIIRGPLTVLELRGALAVTVRCVQKETFNLELRVIAEGGQSKHRLSGLKPFIDPQDDMLRVGGRLKNALIPYDSRHQMLLPGGHPFVDAIVRSLHRSNLHIGQKGLLALVRQRFWPLRVKSTIRKVIANCITCFRANPLKTSQLMGDLPSYRIQPAPTFAYTGVDFAGPFLIKSHTASRRPLITKAYVCLFVCMLTRAIHLELVSDLTTSAFLAALRRFTSIWEAGVKQVEAVLNSRPLVPCSDDPCDLTAITPAHFLIGREMKAVTEPSYLNVKQSTLSRWQLVQTIFQHFWRRWTAEYLPELQNRAKWTKATPIAKGALVLMADQGSPPFEWPLIKLHPGKDNICRVVTVKTSKGEYKRAITEVCLLPLDSKPD
ncbi:uncharacterized protein LOC134219614 [Armigeres subalbatus]|uniref:uncharacterized protein LOC134219614 n=1 Tax=Armigeres subalbatus TaxID=124917 RepID=UPI002ED383AD